MPGSGGQDMETRDNGHVRQQRAQCDMMMVVHLCLDSAWSSAVHEAQSDAPLQVRHRGCGCRSRRHVDDLRLRWRVWHVVVAEVRDCASCPFAKTGAACFVHGQAFKGAVEDGAGKSGARLRLDAALEASEDGHVAGL